MTWLAALLWLSAPAAASAQQQYGDPANYPGTYLTHRDSPPVLGTNLTIDVTYYIAPGNFSGQEAALIRQAADIWSNYMLTQAAVVLVEVNSPAGAGIVFNSADLNDATTNLAQATLTTVPGTGRYPDGTPWRQITSATITIDLDPPGAPGYFTGNGSVPPGRYDFLSLILREFGLGLGLGFAANGDPNSVMDGNLAPGDQHQTLAPGDINALATLYGAPEPATWALFGIGLAVLAGRRRFRPK
jgi:hypothetical protein